MILCASASLREKEQPERRRSKSASGSSHVPGRALYALFYAVGPILWRVLGERAAWVKKWRGGAGFVRFLFGF